jgi:threonine synthase
VKNAGNATYFLCDECGTDVDLHQIISLCPKCGGLLETQYDLEGLKKSAHLFSEYIRDSIWRYRDFFPAVQDKNIVSLGEGGTPLIKSKFLGPALGVENLYFKNDTLMPTGSFKDRGYSLAISYAKELGVKRGVTYSSGNAGASFSAYSVRGDFPGLVMVDYQASPTKKSMIMLYGANATVLNSENFEQIADLIDKSVTELGCYSFVNFINPLRHEAMKTYAYEVYSELRRVPDFSFHGMGTGGGLWGTWKGYNELARMGVTQKVPHMAPVQPECVNWLKRAIESGAAVITPYGDGTKTIAQSINGNSPLQGGKRLLKAVRDSEGIAVSVTDEEIMAAMLDLGREGIAAEPSSASSVAGFKQKVKDGVIRSNDLVVCVITGTAFKQPKVVERIASMPKYEIRADVRELRMLLEKLGLY